jgi:uncharacterized protein YndB with AHSA1/START domain
MDAKRESDRKLVVDSVGEREILMTRAVAAPRHLVFDAWTKPEQVSKWLLGPEGWTMPYCTIDLRVGGAYRYLLVHATQPRRLGMSGVYKEIVAPERLVSTESMDHGESEDVAKSTKMFPGEAINTLTLVEKGGVTTMKLHSLYPSREARDGMLASGMEKGVVASFDRLEAMVSARGKA